MSASSAPGSTQAMASAAGSGPAASTASTSQQTQSFSDRAPRGGSSDAEGSDSSAASTTCTRLTGDDFRQALGESFSPTGKATDTHCGYAGSDGSHISLLLAASSGSADSDLQSSQSGCDAGTVQPISVGDGGFTCLAGGMPEAVAVGGGTHYQLTALVLVSISNDTARQGFTTLLGRLV